MAGLTRETRALCISFHCLLSNLVLYHFALRKVRIGKARLSMYEDTVIETK